MISVEISYETQIIIDLLISQNRGDVVTFDAISEALGQDIYGRKHLLYSAIKFVERDNGLVFSNIRGVGYTALASDDLPKIGSAVRSRIRKAARRGVKSMQAGLAGSNDVSDEAKRRILAEQSALGLLEHIAREKNMPNIKDAGGRPLPVAMAAKAFMAAIGMKARQSPENEVPND